MSELLDLLVDLAGDAPEGGMARRRGSTADPPPLPPGLPALPPDPRLIARGLAAVRAHDPGFDEAAVLDRARLIWAQCGGDPTALRGVTLSAVTAGPQRDRVTVRLELAGGRAPREEDWIFERAATATTDGAAGSPGRCPTCGAPLGTASATTCPYCHASLVGTSAWVIAERLQLRAMTDRDAAALAVLAAAGSGAGTADRAVAAPPPAAEAGVDLSVLGPGTDAHDLLGTAREVVYAVAAARSQRRPELVAARVTPELAAALREEAATLAAAHRHHVLAFVEVTDAVIRAAASEVAGEGAGRVTVRVWLSGEEYELADAAMELADGTRTTRSWSEDWVLVRAATGEPWLAASSVRVSEPPGSA